MLRNINRIYWVTTYALIIMLSLAGVVSASSGCRNLRSVSLNDENMRYLRSWISSELVDPRIIRMFGRHGALKIAELPTTFGRLNFDFEKAGLSPHFTGITLNRVDTDFYLSFDIIESVSFSEVRDFLMIKTENDFDISDGIYRDKKYYENWKEYYINEEVVMFCR